MNFKYRLPDAWIVKVSRLEEFANGATQVSIRLKDGRVIPEVLVSDAAYLIATRGFKAPPFAIEEISEIFQSEADKNPSQRGGWDYWDEWT